jgi:hypothetical protein
MGIAWHNKGKGMVSQGLQGIALVILYEKNATNLIFIF